jgi:hypothetical protein
VYAASVSVDRKTDLNANVDTTGAQTYGEAITLGANTTLTGTTINTQSTLAGGNNALTITGAADIDGALTGLTALSVSGTSNIGANVTTSGTVSSAATVVSVSTAGFSGGSFHITGNAGANTITFEQSNDNSNWALLPTTDVSSSTASPSSTTTSATLRAYATSAAYVRARVSTYVSGSVSITLTQKRVAPQIIGQALAGNSAVIGDVGVQYRTNATGAATPLSYQSGGTTAASAIKASAGRLVGWQLSNSAASLRSVKLFNVASGGVTMGTTSAVFEIDIPAGGVSNFQLPGGIAFGTAISAAITSAKGLTDNTATGLASGDVSGAFFYA